MVNTSEQSISYAVMHDTAFLPTSTGKGVNLKATLDANGIEGKSKNLKMTLLGTMVLVEADGGRGLFPLSNFKLLVPAANG